VLQLETLDGHAYNIHHKSVEFDIISDQKHMHLKCYSYPELGLLVFQSLYACPTSTDFLCHVDRHNRTQLRCIITQTIMWPNTKISSTAIINLGQSVFVGTFCM